WVIYWFACRVFDRDRAIAASLIYSGSLLVVAIGRMMMTDGPLALCLCAAFATFFISIKENAPRWRIVTAACLGLAVLAKGPVALVLFVGIAGISFLTLRDLRSSFRGGWVVGTLVL